MKKIYIICLVMVFLMSCKNENNHASHSNATTITIVTESEDVLNMSTFVDSIELVPLETKDDNLIGWIPRIIATKDYYYLLSASGWNSKKLFIFDKKGHFIRQISKEGEGPGEYIELRDFTIVGDSIIKIAEVYNMMNFDIEGNLLSERKQRDTSDKIVYLKGKSITYNIGARNRNNLLLTLHDSEDRYIKDFLEVSPLEARINDCFGRGEAFAFDENYIYFNHPFSNIIYRIDISTQEYLPFYQINFKDKNLSWKMFAEDGDVNSWANMLEKSECFLAIDEILDMNNYFVINAVDEKYHSCFSIYSKRTGKILTGRQIKDDLFLKGNLVNLKPMKTPHYKDGDYLLWVISPQTLLNGFNSYRELLGEKKWDLFCKKYPHLVEVCSQLDEESNPALARIKIKDF
ncbi:6-bladed beta-propeller [Phocaeicola faecalis]|uniref:6-bladed beta-propeller n=1 Tax=Phocaeicola faecalis TaxID=2786956 RepID=UPI001F3AFBB1|nr:6-bladed beta-propeller [Phocaeicola faecalis]